MLKQLKKRQKIYKDVFGTEKGKKVLKDLYKTCKVNRTDVTENARKDAFNQGRKSVYLTIINILGQDLDKIMQDPEQSEVL